MREVRDHERDDMAGCGKRPSVDPVLVGEFLERPLRKVLDDLLQDGVYSLARCLGFCFHGTRIVYEEGRPGQRVLFSVRRFCGDAASRQSHESIAQGSPVASVVLPAETHCAEGNVLLRLVDFGVATVATPGVCGSGELSGAVSEHCATNREEEIRTPDWKCNRSRLKVKWRRVRLGEAERNRIRYGMVVNLG